MADDLGAELMAEHLGETMLVDLGQLQAAPARMRSLSMTWATEATATPSAWALRS